MVDDERWKARFRAARMSLPRWARDAPNRSIYRSNVTGTWEIYTWDRETGAQRQMTDRPNGTWMGTVDPSGEWMWWFADTDGDEFGVWNRIPFDGTESESAVPGLEPSYPSGLSQGAVVSPSSDGRPTRATPFTCAALGLSLRCSTTMQRTRTSPPSRATKPSSR